MFEDIRKVLDDFENAYSRVVANGFDVSKEDENTIIYFNVNLAKALMQDEYTRSESVAKIILAAKELSNEIVVEVK
jgi:hypothetical protein